MAYTTPVHGFPAYFNGMPVAFVVAPFAMAPFQAGAQSMEDQSNRFRMLVEVSAPIVAPAPSERA